MASMSDGTKIEWTDATWNVVNGCSVVSPGCTNCYAMRLAGTRLRDHPSRSGLTKPTKAGPVWAGEVRFNGKVLDDPLRWQRPRRIFVCAHGDLFHPNVPNDWIDRVFAVMALAPQHQFQVLTKRAARMREYLSRPDVSVRVGMEALGLCCESAANGGTLGKGIEVKATDINPGALKVWPLPNVWLGVSAEDQTRADERIPHLLATPAAIRWVSAEPLLAPINLNHIKFTDRTEHGVHEMAWESALDGKRYDIWAGDDEDPNMPGFPKLDWVIVGGESGPGARPMHPDWARSLRDQCAAAGVPFLFKQWGEWAFHRPVAGGDLGGDVRADRVRTVNPSGRSIFEQSELTGRGGEPGMVYMRRAGKRAAGRLLDGVLHDGYPA